MMYSTEFIKEETNLFCATTTLRQAAIDDFLDNRAFLFKGYGYNYIDKKIGKYWQRDIFRFEHNLEW